MSEFAELLKRVEAATGPDREIDAAIARATNWVPSGVNASLWNANEPKPEHWYSEAFGMPSYTASIDAALALVERNLPNTPIDLSGSPWAATLHNFITPAWHIEGRATTAPLAILSALLRALLHEGQG